MEIKVCQPFLPGFCVCVSCHGPWAVDEQFSVGELRYPAEAQGSTVRCGYQSN